MKTLFVILCLVPSSLLFFKENRPALKINSRKFVSLKGNYYAAPYNLKWFDKDLNLPIQGKLTGNKGC